MLKMQITDIVQSYISWELNFIKYLGLPMSNTQTERMLGDWLLLRVVYQNFVTTSSTWEKNGKG